MPANDDRIITLNCGVGRDSTTMLCLLFEGKLHVEGLGTLGVTDIDCAVFSDTGCEWPHTYALEPKLRRLCGRHGLPFITLAKPACIPNVDDWRCITMDPWTDKIDEGCYHYRLGVIADYQSRQTVVSLGKGDCTDNHKIQPIRRFLSDLSRERFGKTNRQWSSEVRKGNRLPHLALIGYAADETRRLDNGEGRGPKYHSEAFPLIDMDIDKKGEAEVLKRWRLNSVKKSGCFACLAGETEVVTRDGIAPIGSLVDLGKGARHHDLLVPQMGTKGGLGHRGYFKPAEVRWFGKRRLWRLELRRGKATRTVRVTRDHRWFLVAEGQWAPMSTYEKRTDELQVGDRLRPLRTQPPNKEKLMPVAAAQGFVFGDGTRGEGERPASVVFFGEKYDDMKQYFSSFDFQETTSGGKRHPWIYGVPRFWKKPPPIRESRAFLLSWLAGYVAADGSVSKNRQVVLTSAVYANIAFARDAAAVCGIGYGTIVENRSAGLNAIRKTHSPMYSITLRLADLPDWFFLREAHRRNAWSGPRPTRDYPWKVMSVAQTAEENDVYCAVVEDEGAFGLSMDLMTGNCPYQPAAWWWALSVSEPELWQQAVEYERVALARNPRMAATGFKIKGQPATIEQMVERWREKNPKATVKTVLAKTYSQCTERARAEMKGL